MKTDNKQTGTVLILSMIILLVMTIIGLSSMSSTIMEEKMSQNVRDTNLAFEAAEAALRDSGRWLNNQVREPVPMAPDGCSGSPCDVYLTNAFNDEFFKNPASWTDDDTREYQTADKDFPEVSDDPKYVIEYQAFIPDSLVRGYEAPTGQNVYRATARGTGKSTAAQAIVQDSFVKRFN
jgi:type IV pilus assembly protein PilX